MLFRRNKLSDEGFRQVDGKLYYNDGEMGNVSTAFFEETHQTSVSVKPTRNL